MVEKKESSFDEKFRPSFHKVEPLQQKSDEGKNSKLKLNKLK